MDFENYDLDPSIYDELLQPDGTPWQHCQQLCEALRGFSAEELADVQGRVTPFVFQ